MRESFERIHGLNLKGVLMGHMEKDFGSAGRLCITGSVITLYNEMGEPVRRWSYGDDKLAARAQFFHLVEVMEAA